jgi:hypothetical protein
MSSSLKRTPASRTNRARSQVLSPPEGKLCSSQNAVRRGLFARCNRPAKRNRANLSKPLLIQHMDRFQPAAHTHPPSASFAKRSRFQGPPGPWSPRGPVIPNEP